MNLFNKFLIGLVVAQSSQVIFANPCSNIPSFQCTGSATYCEQLVTFNPRSGTGYFDYAVNGETNSNQYRSYIRRDVSMVIKYAAAKVACVAANWSGNGGALGLGDMSEANGAIPGTATGNPGHPDGTHMYGSDIDIAYYQKGTSDNTLRSVCPDTSNGRSYNRCIAAPTRLDAMRTALFIGYLHDSPILKVVGVDGFVSTPVYNAIKSLCQSGHLKNRACNNSTLLLAFETENTGRNWFYHHHHHFHASFYINGLQPIR